MTIEERVAEILAAVGAGGRFSGVEVIRTATHRERGGLFVRLTIDREGGVDTALCESISNHVVNQLDRLDPAIGPYHVEVESAGVERPLLKPEHYRRFVGRRARVITHLHIHNRTEFTGTIESADDETVTISDAAIASVEIPYAAIKRANLTFEIRDDLRRK